MLKVNYRVYLNENLLNKRIDIKFFNPITFRNNILTPFLI